MATARYNADEIQVLEGLEPVRLRPAMYIGSTDSRALEHMLLEVVSNSIDEHISNHADQLSVSFDDEAVVVEDNGRGIPVEVMPLYGRSTLEALLTRLHSGATFDDHQPHVHIRPGFHGVGLAIVNALSERFEADVHRDGGHHRIALSRGLVTEPFHRVGSSTRTGTRIRYRADPEIFGSARLDSSATLKRLRNAQLAHARPDVDRPGADHTFSWPRRLSRRGSRRSAAARLACSRELRVSVRPRRREPLPDLAQSARPDSPNRRRHRAVASRHRSARLRVSQLRAPHRGLSRRRRHRRHRARISRRNAGPRAANRRRIHLGLLHPDFEGPTRAGLHVPEVRHLIADALFQSLSEASDTRIAWLAAARERRPGRGSEGRDS